MNISIEKIKGEIKTEFEGVSDEKDILLLYEFLGRDICKKLGFDYSRLLQLMLKRQKETL
ncbi:MAG: hypothetical protein ACRDAQ_03925 [Cetobacterium sp.]